ncbi:hypothetical protein BVRB_7g157100 [Beta vulgaris subsp. vulgaris]|nr:hypothetical protein BVRB_7g157100 [Beta vulgaris subsp. vulgaris]
MVLLLVILACLVLLLIDGGSLCLQNFGSGFYSWLGFAWQAISWIGLVVSDFESRIVLRDLTRVRFQFTLVMILLIITSKKPYLKAALQFVNWIYSASTQLSFSSKEKPVIPFQQGNGSRRNVTLEGSPVVESHVTKGHGDWTGCEIIILQFSLLLCCSVSEINPLLPFPSSGCWRSSSICRRVPPQLSSISNLVIKQLYPSLSLSSLCFNNCSLIASVEGMLMLICLMVMSISIISMLVFACADNSESEQKDGPAGAMGGMFILTGGGDGGNGGGGTCGGGGGGCGGGGGGGAF